VDTVFKHIKRLLVTDQGAISVFEGLMLAACAVAILIGMRAVTFSPAKQETRQTRSITLEEGWQGLPPAEPMGPTIR